MSNESNYLEEIFPWLKEKYSDSVELLQTFEIKEVDSNLCNDVCTIVEKTEEDYLPVIDDDMIDQINNSNAGWVAHRNSKFEGMNIDEVKNMLGTIVDPDV